jgi:glycosyltransferase involved in cell wall biosynthesis
MAWHRLRQRFAGRSGSRGATPPRVSRIESRPRSEIRWWPRERRDLVRAYFAALEYGRFRGWARDAARVALKIYDPHRHRAVITCGPPHAAHTAGLLVARRTALPLVLDLRDPWSLLQRFPEGIASPLTLFLHRRDERRAVEQAALVVANTHPARNAMRQRYAHASRRIIAVPNGFDNDPVPPSEPSRRFTIAYTGSIYLDRDPRVLLRGVSRVARDLQLTPNDLALEFMGQVETFDGMPLETIAREEGVAEFTRVRPAGSRAEARALQARATMLVVLPQDSDLAIPAKVFDYARFDAWILAFAERGSAVDLLLQGSPADLVRPDDVDGLSEVLRKRYLQHVRGERGSRLSSDERLSRRAQAAVFFEALEGIVGSPRRPPRGTAAPAQQLSKIGS